MQFRRESVVAMAAAALVMASHGPAPAHPHVWIDVHTTLVAADDALIGLRHRWTFDPLFSAWEADEVDTDGDGRYAPTELAVLADRYATTLPDWSFFTEVRQSMGPPVTLVARNVRVEHADGRLTLHLDLMLSEPLALARLDTLRVHDRTFFVSLGYPLDGTGVTLEGSDCAVLHHPPGRLDPALEARLAAIPASQRELPPELAGRVRDAGHRIDIDCPAP